jgi:hypothetical protein
VLPYLEPYLGDVTALTADTAADVASDIPEAAATAADDQVAAANGEEQQEEAVEALRRAGRDPSSFGRQQRAAAAAARLGRLSRQQVGPEQHLVCLACHPHSSTPSESPQYFMGINLAGTLLIPAGGVVRLCLHVQVVYAPSPALNKCSDIWMISTHRVLCAHLAHPPTLYGRVSWPCSPACSCGWGARAGQLSSCWPAEGPHWTHRVMRNPPQLHQVEARCRGGGIPARAWACLWCFRSCQRRFR